MPKDDWVFWLNVTNFALGAVVFLAVAVVIYAVVAEIAGRYRKPREVAANSHEFDSISPDGRSVPDLGLTMADGGERIKARSGQPDEIDRDS